MIDAKESASWPVVRGTKASPAPKNLKPSDLTFSLPSWGFLGDKIRCWHLRLLSVFWLSWELERQQHLKKILIVKSRLISFSEALSGVLVRPPVIAVVNPVPSRHEGQKQSSSVAPG